MKKCLILVPIIMCYSCAIMHNSIQENVELLNADSLKVSYNGVNYSLPLKDKDIYYSNEFEFPNIGADTLYSVCRLVMPDIFNSAESVIQMEDANLRTIVGKGFSTQTYKTDNFSAFSHNVYYTLRVQCFKNNVKISIYNMHSRNLEYTSLYTQGYNNYYITDAVTKGVSIGRVIQDNTYGALIFSFYDTSIQLQDAIIKKMHEYLKENF